MEVIQQVRFHRSQQLPAWLDRLLEVEPGGVRRALEQTGDAVIVKEHHGSAASSFELRGRVDERDWVARYPEGGAALAWRWPCDPSLPTLERLVRTGALPPGVDWMDDGTPPGPTASLQRIGYKPGRRAVFRMTDGDRRFLLKVMGEADFARTMRMDRIASAAANGMGVAVPRVLGAAQAHGVVVMEWVDGEVFGTIRQAPPGTEPFDAVAALMDRLHRSVVPGLPAWSFDKDLGKMRRLVRLLSPSVPWAAHAIPLVDVIEAREGGASPATVTIHGDLTLRNLVWSPGVPVQAIDWDGLSLGPAERDLSAIASSLPHPDAFVAGYAARIDRPIDRGLVTTLVAAQQVSRALRKVLRGSAGRQRTCARLAALRAILQAAE